MNFTLVKTGRIRNGKRPIHLRKTSELMNDLGVSRIKFDVWDGHGQIMPKRKRNNLGFMWDRFEEARQCHRNLIRQHHPDRGGCTERAAEINSIWRTIKDRFKLMGIGTMMFLACAVLGQSNIITAPIVDINPLDATNSADTNCPVYVAPEPVKPPYITWVPMTMRNVPTTNFTTEYDIVRHSCSGPNGPWTPLFIIRQNPSNPYPICLWMPTTHAQEYFNSGSSTNLPAGLTNN